MMKFFILRIPYLKQNSEQRITKKYECNREIEKRKREGRVRKRGKI